MNEMWNQQQYDTAFVKQQQQQQQQQQQIQQIQQFQQQQSFNPTSAVETFGRMPASIPVQTLQHQQNHAQIDGEHMNDHVQFIQQADPQFMQHYNGQVVMPGAMLPCSTPDTIQEQPIQFPDRHAASSTIANQSLVMGQLNVINNQSDIEHKEMEQSFVSCATGKTLLQFSPWQQLNTSFPQKFAWVTPHFPPLLDCMHSHQNFLKSISPKSSNQQTVQTPMFVQSPSQQCYGQTMMQTNDGVLQNSEEMVCDVATTAITSKSHCIGTQPIMVESSIGMKNNNQALVSSQNEQQSSVLDFSVVSQSSQTLTAQLPFSTRPQKSVLMPPVIIEPDESLKTSIVQTQEDSIAKIENAETITSVLPEEESTNDKDLPKALIKPQVSTYPFEDFGVQNPDQLFSEITSSSVSSDIFNSMQDIKNTPLNEPASKRIKLEIFNNNSVIEQMDQVHVNNWECESSCSEIGYFSSSNNCFNEEQNIKNYLPSELAFISLLTWTVEDVRKFISFIADCNEIAAKFEYHEIDGEALMLLRLVHLVRDMEIKLGPALKLFAILNAIREKIKRS